MKMKFLMLFLALLLHHSIAYPSVQSDSNNNKDDNIKITEKDNESSKKIIGSSVVTSVSVILNGEGPQFTDAVGHRIPKPQVPLQVASPINLLNPDRYEFYTFDNNGQLVKRIMTLQEIHSIVANGDGDGGATVIHNSQINNRNPEKNVQDIVASVQNVLTKEVEWKKNLSNPDNHQHHQMLDTPDVSSSWSMILPAIFGNTGGDIFTTNNRPPQQVVMTPDSDVVEHSTKPNKRKPTKQTKRKPTITITTPTTIPSQKIPIVDDLITTTTSEILNTPIAQKIFVNNQERIKPLFNRNDVKNDLVDNKIEISTISSKPTTIITSTSKQPQKTKPTKITTIPSTTTTKRKPITTIMPISESTIIKNDSEFEKITTTTKYGYNKHKFSTTKIPSITTMNVNTTPATKHVHNKNKYTTTKMPATTAPTTLHPIATKKIQKQSTTTEIPNSDNIRIPITVQLIQYKKTTPSTTQTILSTTSPATITTSQKLLKRKQTTTTRKSTTPSSTVNIITTNAMTTDNRPTTENIELPLNKKAEQIVTTTATESLNKIFIDSDKINSSTETITEIDLMKNKDTATVAMNAIVNSLLEQNDNHNNDEDMNTKLSFDQIIESLQDNNNNNKQNDEINKKNIPTKIPILYNNNNNEKLKPIKKITLKPTLKPIEEELIMSNDIRTTTIMNDNYEKIDMTTYSPTSLESINIDDLNVKYDPLYAELLDPILTQLNTTKNSVTTDLPSDITTTLMPLIKESSDDSDNFKLNKPNEEQMDDKNIEHFSQTFSDEMNSNSHSSELTQKVEDFIANTMQSTEKVYIKLENPIIKDYLLKQDNEMNMKDLQKEIATVASTLEDNIIYTTTMNPNNKLDNNSNDDEIQALLSDVYNQITNAPLIQTNIPTILPTENLLKENNNNDNIEVNSNIESTNRLTNLAQMSTSILLPSPSKDITQQLNSNDKFHLLETLSLKLNETNYMNKNNNDNDHLPINNLNKTIYNNNNNNMTNVYNKIVIEQKNNVINSNSMNLNKNLNAIELNKIIKTEERILPIDDYTNTTKKKIEINENDNMEIEDENVTSSSTSTEFTFNDTYDDTDDNIFDSSTINAIKIIESLIKTTVQPLIENNIIKTTITENPEKLTTTILYNNSEFDNINNDDISMNLDNKKNSEKENIPSNEMIIPPTTTTTIEFDTEMKYNNNNSKFHEIQEDEKLNNSSSQNFIENNIMKNDNNLSEQFDSTTLINDEINESKTEQSTEIEMELVELITKPTPTSEKTNLLVRPTQTTTDIFNMTETEQIYVKLGESTERPLKLNTTISTTTNIIPTDEDVTIRLTIIPQTISPINRKPTLKPVHYFKQPISQTDQKLITFNNNQQQRPVIRPAALTNLKITQISSATRSPVKLEPSPEQSLGLEASTLDLQEDIQEFARLCNELAFNYWRSITSEKISNARSLVLSPFALTSMLSMVFLGARGSTSGEMNEILRLDDMVTFNPHLVFKNITESVEHAKDSDIASSAFVREIFSDRSNGKILPFFKEKTQQIYAGHVEEVNFNVVNDIIRRRTNLLIKRHTGGKVMEYLRTNSVWVNGPLSTVTANLFQTDCTRGSINDRDGEMFFQVHPSIRQRRLIPIPAVVWRIGFTAGYDPELDATVVAFGSTDETISTIYVMPGQHGLAAPGDNLERLERNIMENGISKNVWSHLLTSLMQRPGLEVQLPRFSHRSFVNASIGLQKLGLKALFNSDNADLGGLTGSSKKDIYLADMIQINTFSTCGEEKISDHHHVEMYPAPPLRKRNSDIGENDSDFMDIEQIDFGSIVHNTAARGFYDDLLDPKYLELPLPLRPRQARIPDAPRLRFDKPFLYFVRHNPTGMILFMGRFNPRLLP